MLFAGTTCRWRNERNGAGERAVDNLDWATGGGKERHAIQSISGIFIGTWDRLRAQTAFNLPHNANPFGTGMQSLHPGERK